MAGRNQHIVPRDGDWAVRGEGNPRDTSRHDTQAEAIDAARGARNQGSELLIHDRHGRIHKRDSHGGDPLPAARSSLRA